MPAIGSTKDRTHEAGNPSGPSGADASAATDVELDNDTRLPLRPRTNPFLPLPRMSIPISGSNGTPPLNRSFRTTGVDCTPLQGRNFLAVALPPD
ncbi:hypothetical protein AAE478_008518 [Parahypoxylon ruwenzoriense]